MAAEWESEGLVIGAQVYGESGLILDVLTRERGRRRGFVHGGTSRKKRALFEIGASLQLSWRARVEDQLGRFDTTEPIALRAAGLIDAPAALLALSSVTALLRDALPENQALPGQYEAAELVLEALTDETIWPALYVRWEAGLLAGLGYGMDLKRCAVTGDTAGLAFVSPRTGRAVTHEGAGDYADKLLSLPAFLVDASAEPDASAIAAGLRLTGFFLERRLFADTHRAAPDARTRLIDKMRKAGLCAA